MPKAKTIFMESNSSARLSLRDSLFQRLCFAGGTGKTECIKELNIAAKLIFGMKGPYEPLVNVAPTGSAASNIDGFTWQSFLHCLIKMA